jgi:hypothetical protein
VRAPKVEIAAGDGFDLLVSAVAVAVADSDWRDVLTHGPAVWSTVRREMGAETTRQVARFGRFGWINLIGLLATARTRGGRDDLVTVLDHTSADELRLVVAGGRREQMTMRLGAERLRAALAGDAPAMRELTGVLAAPAMLLDVAGWVRRTPPTPSSRRSSDGWSTPGGHPAHPRGPGRRRRHGGTRLGLGRGPGRRPSGPRRPGHVGGRRHR